MALSLVLILIAGINFSLLIPVNKIAGDAGFPNFAYVFWYALGAGLILLIPAIIRRELPQLTVPHLRLYFISATLGFAFPFALLAFVATKLPSGVTVLLITLTPLFTYSLAVIARLERFQPICAAGLLAGIAGVPPHRHSGRQPAGTEHGRLVSYRAADSLRVRGTQRDRRALSPA